MAGTGIVIGKDDKEVLGARRPIELGVNSYQMDFYFSDQLSEFYFDNLT